MIERAAGRLVEDALADTPVVLIMGPRQAGKSTLAKQIANAKLSGNYITLDDPIALSQAVENPQSFLLGRKPPVVIDEVQRAPGLFLAIKLLVDRDRKPGMFLLSGSANVLVMPKVADSLAGRMEPIDLLPFSQAELEGSGSNFVDSLFGPEISLGRYPSLDTLPERICIGGYPEVIQRKSADRRDAWFQSYIRTILDRDVRDLAQISGLTQMPRLLSLLAARNGGPLNIASLAVDTGVPHTTLTRYIDLLKALFLVQTVPAWTTSPDARLTKTAKAFLVDTGLLAYLNGARVERLQNEWMLYPSMVKSFVANELLKLSKVSRTRPELFHLRTVKQKEVDFVLESRSGGVVGVMVRAEQSAHPNDLEALTYLSELVEDKFVRGVVLHTGNEAQRLGENLFSIPISALWA